jgi:hypothetical protein
VLPSRGVETPLDAATAQAIARDLVAAVPAAAGGKLRVWLEAGTDQGPPTAVAQFAGRDYRLHTLATGRWALASGTPAKQAAPVRSVATSERLTNVATAVGLDFRQGSFRYGMSNEAKAMMGGGVCWLDANGDGWLDLFAVNSYASADTAQWEAQGGLPRAALYENEHGRFRDVSRGSGADLQVQGDGCVAGDLNGDGRTDLVVTTTSGIDLLWNRGGGRFAEGARTAGLTASGCFTGAAVADVNGDGRPDVFVAGYSDENDPVAGSLAGFPTNVAGVRDRLYLNEGNDSSDRARFREVGVAAGLESARPRHGLGAVFLDYNDDGRPDLYVANDEDPNQLYENVAWPGGAKADPTGLGFRLEERGAAEGVADPFAGMGVAVDGVRGAGIVVTNSRGEPSAAFAHLARAGSPAFRDAGPSIDPALGTGFAGWGASWVDLSNSGSPSLVLTAGAIPVTSLSRDAEAVRVLSPETHDRYGEAQGILGAGGLRLNGRGLAAADAGNDGRMDVAINTVGGALVLLRPKGPSGHWLDVELSRFAPGAVVTAELSSGGVLRGTVRAGSSYLSSEDPRVHFGLGTAKVNRITVRYPWGATSRVARVPVDGIVRVPVPGYTPPRNTPAAAPLLGGCTPANLGGESVARFWNETAVAALTASGASEPVQARDLFHLSAASWDAWAAYSPTARGYFVTQKASATDVQRAREAAISFAAYRLLVWRVSFGSNLDRTFALLTERLRSLCYSPSFTSTSGSSAAALGNRIAAAAIAWGRHDGSLEALRYDDASYVPTNQPLVLSEAGAAAHDATFWQPLALGTVAAHGLGAVPAKVQSFVGAQWGGVRGFALGPAASDRPLDPGPPPFADPSSPAYRSAAVDEIRATSAGGAVVGDASPLAWNVLADSLREHGGAAARLRSAVALGVALNGALDDAAIAAWGAKRAYQSPRPISMIRHLAFEGQSSDPKAPSYSRAGLPLVPGLIEVVTDASSAPGGPHRAFASHVGQIVVRSQGRWVLGARWAPPVPTPASPGWVSERSTFAYAADHVLTALTGRSFDREAERFARSGVASGIETPADEAAGRALGTAVGRRAWARAVKLGLR